MGKASTRAQNRYIAKAYDRINLTVPKGKKEVLQAHAETQGESVNGFINRAIDNQITQDGHKGPCEAQQALSGAGVVSLPSEAFRTAQEAAEAAGEGLAQFIDRAVTTQAKRDAEFESIDEVNGNLTTVHPVPSGTLAAARAAAIAAGEKSVDFIVRALSEQAKRDAAVRKEGAANE